MTGIPPELTVPRVNLEGNFAAELDIQTSIKTALKSQKRRGIF